MADISDVARDILVIKQKLEEMDRRLVQLSKDVQKISSHFADKEIEGEKSVIGMI